MKKLYPFTVSGYANFPVDMLRQDECWPADTNSALLIGSSFQGATELHAVKLLSSKRPTRLRWNSFGWGFKEGH